MLYYLYFLIFLIDFFVDILYNVWLFVILKDFYDG